ncbi:MAG: hypothetical protein JJLCMIEE_01553 [Acidimicrobiales bacterium]|nr:MAG: LytR family transcriptional regulator [Actinomycetota bacterium]MBV6508489.1 hypothetical protein [Acidimicrobiales bacterium]RIK05193.1 MAG: hypothetical protein DCC48_11290 [Acidobacteriota bacterium]
MTSPRSSDEDRFSKAAGAGNAATRGVILIVVAVVIGIVVIVSGLDREDVIDDGDEASDTTTTEASSETTTTTTESTTTTEVPTDTTPPEDVKIVVANASGGVAGLAGTTKDQILVPAGYAAENIETVDASPVSTTTIFYTEGNEANAAALATLMSVPGAQVQPMPDPPPVEIGEADILIMLGPDSGTTQSDGTQGTTDPGGTGGSQSTTTTPEGPGTAID